ncbi:MAG TPA: hypothetical protein VMV05_04390 [bacterium]|nr:hypothetical protein [bacterium]
MEINPPEVESKVIETAETLWTKFEKTGSVNDYLLYLQKLKKSEKPVSFYLPS